MTKRVSNISAVILTGGVLMITTPAALGLTNLNSPQTASIEIIRHIQFGAILPCHMPGTVTVTPHNQRMTTGCVIAIGAQAQAAQAYIRGAEDHEQVISVSPIPAMLQHGAYTMTVDNFRFLWPGGKTGTDIITITPTPQGQLIDIGADLRLQAHQPAGLYQGSFTLMIDML